jgi:putative ABC transport system ATP-binding protein
MGPSGSGKSTLLSILGALNPPSRGRLVIDDIDIYSLSNEKLADFRSEYFGFVFQQFNLIPYLTALENVMLPLAVSKAKSVEKRNAAAEVLQKVGLGSKLDRLPNQLSGGEQERVAIARAIVNRPPILLADEPTGALDTKTGREVLDFLQKLNEEGNTIVLITHDMGVAERAKRIIRISDGRIVEDTGHSVPATAGRSSVTLGGEVTA